MEKEVLASTSNSTEQLLVRVARIMVGVMFVFSGVSKILSINFFDTEILGDLFFGKEHLFEHPTGMFWTQILSRLIISGEIVLGIAVLQEKWFKKVVLPTVMLLLILFTLQLIYEGFRQDNFVTGNCGCFGKVLPMTILESILKNVATMLIGIFIWVKYKPEQHGFKSWVSPVLVGLVCMGTLLFTVMPYESNIKVTPLPDNGNGATTDTDKSWKQEVGETYRKQMESYQFEEALKMMEDAIQKDSSLLDTAKLNRLREIVEIQGADASTE